MGPAPPSEAEGRISLVACPASGQILPSGSTYDLPAVLVAPITVETGWSWASVVDGVSLAALRLSRIGARLARAVALLQFPMARRHAGPILLVLLRPDRPR
ncbi:MAG: hypothetical protein U1E45_10605 [Geminicoccaceae bacterium]